MNQIFNLVSAVVLAGLLSLTPRVWADDFLTPGITPIVTPGVTQDETSQATPAATPARHHRAKKAKAIKTEVPVDQTGTPTVPPTTQFSPSPTAQVSSASTPAAAYELNSVVITSTKTKLKVLDSPAEVEIVNQSDIQQKNVVYFDEALQGLPGVQDAREDSGDQAVTVNLRGIPGYDKTLVLLDGFNLNQTVNQRVFWNRVPNDLVQDVEIVEGPFSSLYGKSALGGVINIITREPEGESFHLSEDWQSDNVLTSGVSYQDRIDNYFAYYFGFQNTSINGETFNAYIQPGTANNLTVAQANTLGAAVQPVSGFQTTTTSSGATAYNIGQQARTQLENNNFSSKFYWDPAPDQKFNLLVNFSDWDQENTTPLVGSTYLQNVNTGSLVNNGPVSLVGTGKNYYINTSEFLKLPGTNGFLGTYLSYTGKLNDDLGLTAHFDYTSGPFLHSESTAVTTATAIDGAATGSDAVNNWEYYGNVQGDLKLDNHQLIFGLEDDVTNSDNYSSTYANWTNLNSFTDSSYFTSGGTNSTQAVFAQDEWKIFKPLTAFLGARLDEWNTTNGQDYVTPTGGTSYIATYPDRTFYSFNPKVSLVFKIDENGSLRASAGTAFNPPTYTELYSVETITATTDSKSNPNLSPEDDASWEIGGEYQFPTKTTLSATYFQNYVTNLIYQETFLPDSAQNSGPLTVTQYYNAGQADIFGVEGEVKQQLFSSLKGYANYTHLDTQFVSDSAAPTAVGHQIPYVPSDRFNAGLELSLGPVDLSADEEYESKEYVLTNNADTVNGVQGSLDPYWLTNVKLNYRFNEGRVSLGVNNVFNNQYFVINQVVGTVYTFGASLLIL
jgi:iron complex outermembrane recepter protein